jgi:hypothetical protein
MKSYFSHGQEQAQKSAKIQLEMIMSNLTHLSKVRNGVNLCDKARQFNDLVKRGVKLSPNQLSFIDSIYEKMWKGAGFESHNLHIDKKKKGLRF